MSNQARNSPLKKHTHIYPTLVANFDFQVTRYRAHLIKLYRNSAHPCTLLVATAAAAATAAAVYSLSLFLLLVIYTMHPAERAFTS